ncbi:MAG: ornithine cyclodeaminase [Candidatus Levybacteria bacterium RIFCSPHIGHO2_12_FULL_38_12]|nr:MAG: ornithine cyclodeaminase [Candidatus Levybacteria bacterium RIFCSPHIGHO2_01_FULL_38_12]OGH22138.1 MAG: ornithine cyclodeaminase [Candidatus Levybacteria bacterium RIFCSPHIGHO2_02_FULL_37_18]OGH22985.1 MAG: ornithine cyclodeaminase [Candidatus Levybacteria bacterium RIFCSPHIGHO2_12_FULL_38_12]OGH34157.1 MAG: ornithine cyclodeaminase [Candidatus Levybacteria bacterium RIFCSPLOWO2_01_FULL_37_20]OGH44949.1 MAG: ornithine cyclodeaminase [Candidatus Levybacteria bacterium RIFCSPLOWO2_02_FULL_
MKIITVEALSEIINRHGFENFMRDLIEVLKQDFIRWDSFTKMPRPAIHVDGGVLELMPICDNKQYYSFKYVNCHPKNPLIGLSTVVATGQLSRIDTGYPLLFSEMTILTALRTAATSALATDFMARKDSRTLVIIGTGSQSEFQVLALQLIRDIKEVRFFDIDTHAMDKFEKNLSNHQFKLVRCKNAEEAFEGADIITVCTANKAQVVVIKNDWIASGVHINALGGDTVGKTELELSILSRSRITVEYFDQSFIEGEIQRLTRKDAKKFVHAELHELVREVKKGRENKNEITIFDSVGIALEDYSALRLTYELAEEYDIGKELNLTPVTQDPKDLISCVLY